MTNAPAPRPATSRDPAAVSGPGSGQGDGPALVFILGDQLSRGLASLRRADPSRDVVLMVEVAEETTYVPHHKKKIAFILSAMRHFAEALRHEGWTVDYVRLDDPDNSASFTGELARALDRHGCRRVLLTEPGEWRVLEAARAWPGTLGITLDLLTDDRFLCSVAEFGAWARGRKQLRMEYFYREMRRKTGLLMAGDEPEGGQWNFDAENRKPARADLFMPRPHQPEPDAITQEVLDLVERRFPTHFGRLTPFRFAVTVEEAEAVFARFLQVALPSFGDYQDAMLRGEPWLYHSVISPYLNVGLLDPLSVCRRVEAEYRAGRVPLNAAEGFIRQIIGWREYVRGIYWLKMPEYTTVNALEATRPLPDFYWTGQTDMTCLREAIGQTRDEAYAHHIQRLMVTGNFAMLAGIDPAQVHEWYLAVYADAFEWVEAPNTLGMSQFADGGLLGSKPYAGGGNYINKMSDYCSGCRYDVKQRRGRDACPFNALYWDFLARNADRLKGNPRMAQVYATWARMGETEQTLTRQQAAAFLAGLRPWTPQADPT
ncbi:cryptochrome/photolyase family protein [Microvirga tunisiensis]|uniref:Cryptochrome/photolyase family protein n=1 Tax=Pannonibacter tanglangensis TaxID=2750084 RepID=A0A7X5F5E4_9HYPH|nr:cryptochrome/photolyase family protein [Pannonibacter sp. XCT-53]NBN80061.1 cryptochrome/photolyase family protein [Pannonibacter sp. XCT-53]